MNFRRIGRFLGIFLCLVAACMLTSIPWSLYYGESQTVQTFLYSSGITAGVGAILWLQGRHAMGTVYRSEAILLVALSWLLIGVFGGLPYLIEGTFANPANAYFETLSGFTTTGSTVMTDIGAHTHGLQWWRCLTQWLGGMGIIVLFVAIFPKLGVGGKFLFKSEVPGPITEGLKPKIKQTASTLWWLYVGISFAETLVLKALGTTWFDAFVHTFTTMSTGGFSPHPGSIADFNSVPIEMVITGFMLVAGINFGLYYDMLRGKLTDFLYNRELWVYLGIIVVVTGFVSWNVWANPPTDQHESLLQSIRYGLFQTIALVTTTGYATDNFNLYPAFSRLILVMIMFVGGMASSTAGGMKTIRIMVVIKAIYAQVYKIFRPQSVISVRIGSTVIPSGTVRNILGFFALGIFTFAAASLYMTFLGLDLITGTTAVAATLFNIGPGLAEVGAVENFAFIPTSGKIVLTICMVLGRLEFMTLLVLLLPAFWRR
jgi:trk system potassium uptake protein TrkH